MTGLEVRPLTAETWRDFLAVMGPRGGDAGCWCMFNLQSSREFDAHKGDDNRQLMRARVEAGEVPGLIGYLDGQPVGWVAVQPRETYGRLSRSPIAKPLDDRPAWAVTCFVVVKAHRGKGLAAALLDAAVDYAASEGASLVEGYPVEPRHDRTADQWAWTGLASMFTGCGFREVARRSETRPFMRRELGTGSVVE
ncbi:MAG: GNAT family N-acetyltransferase [Actinobacteria bacterium]|nr:GNAT family N-acetyltransferase [Actinomycetota bacterium]